ncbi:MAG: putative nucleic acid-binding protein [Rhodothermales bacterium]|jgi:predicted nucleic acid-binding protein
MNVLDSSGWIEVFQSGVNTDFFEEVLQDEPSLLVPSLCITEVYRVVRRRVGVRTALRVVSLMRRHRVVDISSEIALLAGELGSSHSLALADSIILACTRSHGATLWTQDKDFDGLPDVRYIPAAP